MSSNAPRGTVNGVILVPRGGKRRAAKSKGFAHLGPMNRSSRDVYRKVRRKTAHLNNTGRDGGHELNEPDTWTDGSRPYHVDHMLGRLVQVQQKSEEVAQAHARCQELSAELHAQAADIASERQDLADTLRHVPRAPPPPSSPAFSPFSCQHLSAWLPCKCRDEQPLRRPEEDNLADTPGLVMPPYAHLLSAPSRSHVNLAALHAQRLSLSAGGPCWHHQRISPLLACAPCPSPPPPPPPGSILLSIV